MKFSDILLTALANMRRNKARTILTIIAIFIGAATLTLTNGIGDGIKAYLNRQVGNLGSTNTLQVTVANSPTVSPASSNTTPPKYDPNHKSSAIQDRGPNGGSQYLLSQNDINKIKNVPNVVTVLPGRSISPDYITNFGSDKYQISVGEAYGSINLDMKTGMVVNNNAANNEITIPELYVSPLGFSSDADALNKTVIIAITSASGLQSQHTAKIVGVQNKSLIGSSGAFVNTAFADVLYNAQSIGLPSQAKGQYSFVVAQLTPGISDADIATAKSNLKALGYDATTVKDRVNTVFTVIDAIIIIFDMFGAITLLAATFGIVNTLLMSVQERTKEIGLMKALGMGPRRIFTLFSCEAVLIGFFGSVLGVGFAKLLGVVVNNIAAKGFLKNFEGLQLLAFPFRTLLVIIIGIMLIAFLAGTLPAYRASRKDPIEALRYE